MDRNTRAISNLAIFVLVIVVVILTITASAGLFATTQGYYVNPQALRMSNGNSGMAFGCVYVVMEDRRPGPDRRIAVFNDPVTAWTFMRGYDKQPLPPYIHNARRP